MTLPEHTDILIVGAGLSGLTAAVQLHRAGRVITIFEARDRLGGRIQAARSGFGDSFDLGPAWFWSHHHRVASMLAQYGIESFAQYEDGHMLFEQQSGEPQRFQPPWGQPRAFRFVGGASALIRALAAGLPAGRIHLNQTVKAISHDDNHAFVTTASGHQLTASHVIVTLPPHLAASTIRYTPALPAAVEQAMRQTPTWMGEAMKISLIYNRPFWRDAGLSGTAVSYQGPVQQFHDATPADERVGALFGWVGNHSPGRLLSPQDRRQAVIDQATRLFGPAAAQPLNYDETNWEFETVHQQSPGDRSRTGERTSCLRPSLAAEPSFCRTALVGRYRGLTLGRRLSRRGHPHCD